MDENAGLFSDCPGAAKASHAVAEPRSPSPSEISANACSGGLWPPSGCDRRRGVEDQSKHGGHRPPLQL